MKIENVIKIKAVIKRKKVVAVLGFSLIMLLSACAGDADGQSGNSTDNNENNSMGSGSYSQTAIAEAGAENTGVRAGEVNAQAETSEDAKQQDTRQQNAEQQDTRQQGVKQQDTGQQGTKQQDDEQQITYWLNRHGEIYDSDYASAGLDKTFATTLWISTHEGEILKENVLGSDYPCIAESEKILQAAAEGEKVWDMPGEVSLVWVRMEQEPLVLPEGSLGQTAHKDYIIYRDGEDAYVGLQSVEDGSKWTVSRLTGYGEWLERELDIFIRMTTGL